jgi:hypothetical protein
MHTKKISYVPDEKAVYSETNRALSDFDMLRATLFLQAGVFSHPERERFFRAIFCVTHPLVYLACGYVFADCSGEESDCAGLSETICASIQTNQGKNKLQGVA